ncbi:hypothetical protein B7Z28_00260 [Candidatus Saccharibacteria bacterium 32-45-3]|nr:MAG: hypothetical protein B7Z28_00260 [Candidatus Saccharibacteria bacterium 32-45-3]
MTDKKLPFYTAALLFVGIMIAVDIISYFVIHFATQSGAGLFNGITFTSVMLNSGQYLLQYVIASLTLMVMDRYEDTIVGWMTAFVAGFVVLAFVI